MKSRLVVNGSPETRRDLFAMIPKGLRGAEIGVFKGGFSRYITDKAEVEYLYMVDAWYPVELDYCELYNTPVVQYWNLRAALVSLRYALVSGRARPVVAHSEKAATMIPDDSLDFVYIDADHTKEGCMRDLQLWCPKVRSGGMISGHDICRSEFGVTEAVDEYMKEIGLSREDLHLTKEEYPSFWFIKD